LIRFGCVSSFPLLTLCGPASFFFFFFFYPPSQASGLFLPPAGSESPPNSIFFALNAPHPVFEAISIVPLLPCRLLVFLVPPPFMTHPPTINHTTVAPPIFGKVPPYDANPCFSPAIRLGFFNPSSVPLAPGEGNLHRLSRDTGPVLYEERPAIGLEVLPCSLTHDSRLGSVRHWTFPLSRLNSQLFFSPRGAVLFRATGSPEFWLYFSLTYGNG